MRTNQQRRGTVRLIWIHIDTTNQAMYQINLRIFKNVHKCEVKNYLNFY